MKHKKIILICIGLILVIAITIRVVYINNKFPSQKNNIYTMSQELNYKGCVIKALNYQVGSPEMCKSVLDEYDYNKEFVVVPGFASIEKKVILVTVNIKNNSDTVFNANEFQIVSGNVYNNTNFKLMDSYNKNGYIVKSNSELQVVLVYVISDITVSSKKWDNFENEEFALSCADRTNHNLLVLKK